MGVNIGVKKVIDIDSTNGDIYYKCELQEWFDISRMGQEWDFLTKNDLYHINPDPNRDHFGEQLLRPTDFEKTRGWIKNNMHIGNQERFLKALDIMEQDVSLWFTFDW